MSLLHTCQEEITMSYFQAKSDLEFVHEFANAVTELFKIEAEASTRVSVGPPRFLTRTEIHDEIVREAHQHEHYAELRAKVARGVPRANRIANRLELLTVFESYPMPAVGGPVITVTLFDAILHDPTYSGVPQQSIIDALNQTLGACQERVAIEFRHLINPMYWVKELLVFIIRIPFIIIEASGFDLSKVEDHFLGRAFKLLEIIALIAILVWLGLSKEELRQALVTFLPTLGGGAP
jgi:hypothetical protein